MVSWKAILRKIINCWESTKDHTLCRPVCYRLRHATSTHYIKSFQLRRILASELKFEYLRFCVHAFYDGFNTNLRDPGYRARVSNTRAACGPLDVVVRPASSQKASFWCTFYWGPWRPIFIFMRPACSFFVKLWPSNEFETPGIEYSNSLLEYMQPFRNGEQSLGFLNSTLVPIPIVACIISRST